MSKAKMSLNFEIFLRYDVSTFWHFAPFTLLPFNLSSIWLIVTLTLTPTPNQFPAAKPTQASSISVPPCHSCLLLNCKQLFPACVMHDTGAKSEFNSHIMHPTFAWIILTLSLMSLLRRFVCELSGLSETISLTRVQRCLAGRSSHLSAENFPSFSCSRYMFPSFRTFIKPGGFGERVRKRRSRCRLGSRIVPPAHKSSRCQLRFNVNNFAWKTSALSKKVSLMNTRENTKMQNHYEPNEKVSLGSSSARCNMMCGRLFHLNIEFMCSDEAELSKRSLQLVVVARPFFATSDVQYVLWCAWLIDWIYYLCLRQTWECTKQIEFNFGWETGVRCFRNSSAAAQISWRARPHISSINRISRAEEKFRRPNW